MNVVAIVEGDGEVSAVPILLRRLADWRGPNVHVTVPTPIRVRKDRFLNREDEFRRHLLLAAAKCTQDGWILVLLDADDDCPATVGASILQRASACVSHRRLSVVLAKREYEAWFIAAAESLNGYRGFTYAARQAVDPEIPRDAKGWMREHTSSRTYGETTDQAAFSARMDLGMAYDRSRSFRKLCTEWDKQAVSGTP
jgi:hypothetical protein